MCSSKELYLKVETSVTCNNPELETTKVSSNIEIDKLMCHIHTTGWYSAMRGNKLFIYAISWMDLNIIMWGLRHTKLYDLICLKFWEF